jgi:hypothetical protein
MSLFVYNVELNCIFGINDHTVIKKYRNCISELSSYSFHLVIKSPNIETGISIFKFAMNKRITI